MVSYNSVEYSGGGPIRLARNYINRKKFLEKCGTLQNKQGTWVN